MRQPIDQDFPHTMSHAGELWLFSRPLDVLRHDVAEFDTDVPTILLFSPEFESLNSHRFVSVTFDSRGVETSHEFVSTTFQRSARNEKLKSTQLFVARSARHSSTSPACPRTAATSADISWTSMARLYCIHLGQTTAEDWVYCDIEPPLPSTCCSFTQHHAALIRPSVLLLLRCQWLHLALPTAPPFVYDRGRDALRITE